MTSALPSVPRLSEHTRPASEERRGRALVTGAATVAALVVFASATLFARQGLAALFFLAAVLVGGLLMIGRRRVWTGHLVMVLVALLLLFPAQFRISQLGALGSPGALVGLAAFALWLIGLVLRRPWMAAHRHPLRWMLLGLALSTMASFLAASYRPIDGLESRAAVRGLITILVIAGMVLVVSDTLLTRLDIRRLVQVLVMCGSVVSLLGVLQFRTGIDISSVISIPGFTYRPEEYSGERSGFVRIVSTTTNPLELAVVLAILLPLALYLGFTSSGRKRTFWFVNAGIISATIPMTVSRTAIVAAAVGLFVMMLGWPWRRRWHVLLVGLVGLVAVRLAIPGLAGTLYSFLFSAGGDPSLASRDRGQLFALRFFAERPLLGRGFGTYIPDRYVFLDNQVLLSAVETGVVGLVALFGLMITAIFLGLGVRRAARGPAAAHDRELALALLAGVVTGTVVMVTFDALTFPTSRGLTMIVLGMVGALWRIVRNDVDWAAARAKRLAHPVEPDRPTDRPPAMSS